MSSQDISLGKGKNTININLAGFKGGIRREQLQTEQEKSIFDAVDTNKDGVLDEKEVQQLKEGLLQAAGKKDETNLSDGEAKDFLKEHDLKKVKKEDLFNFVNNISQSSENIKECKTDETNNNVIIEYNDGTTETIRPDKTSVQSKTDGDGTTTTVEYNADGEAVTETIVNGKDGTVTVYQLDENGHPVKDKDGKTLPAQRTVTSDDGQSSAITNYENGVPKEQTITKDGSQTVVQYDENGKESTAVETQGEYTVKNYTYVDGTPRETSRIENKGQDNEKTTEFTYNEDGSVIERSSEQKGAKTSARLVRDGKPVSEEIIEGEKRTTRQYNQDGSYVENSQEGENLTQTQLNSDGNRLTQIKLVDGKQYELRYDGEGNTEGIIVQNGESPASVAKKFGVPLNNLLEVNADKLVGKGKNRSFRVGDSIKIPREMEADEKVLQGRDTSAQAVAKYQKALQAKERDRQLRAIGLKNYKHAGETFNYGGKKYTVLGTMTNRARLLVQDSKGNVIVASWDNKILKEEYVAKTNMYDFGKKMKAADGKEYVVVEDRNDGHGRKIVLDEKGNIKTLSGGSSQTDFNDRVVLRNDYLEASDAYDLTGGSGTITGNGIQYVKDKNGKVWYVDSNTGKFLVKGQYSSFVQKEADAISDKIYDAAHGIGTKTDKLMEGVEEIYSPEILARVNTTLAGKDSDYKGDSHTMPLEALILDEESHGNSRKYFKKLIDNKVMTTEQIGNTVARELQHEVEGGLGYTATADVNEVMNLVPQNDRNARLATEASLGRLRPDLTTNEGSLVRAYLKKDGWDPDKVDMFDSNWVANGSYTPELDQAHRNAVIGRLCFEYDDKETLHKGLRACSSDPESADYKYLSDRAAEANKERGYQSQFTAQEAVQTYLAGRSNEDGEVDVGQLSACNTLLFKGSKPPRVQAEEALYGAKKGEMSKVFDSMDSEVYDSMAEILANGDVPGCSTVKEAYDKAYSSAYGSEKRSIKANAILSGHVEFTQQEITDFCIELMHSIDDNKGQGGSTGSSASHTNDAEYQTEQLKAILTQHPEVIEDVRQKVQAGKFKVSTMTSTFNEPGMKSTVSYRDTDTKDKYLNILDNSQCIVKDEVFLDENGNKITDKNQIEALKQANNEALSQMREYVAQLEREFKMGVDEEGWLDDTGNALVRYTGVGTDRDDVANKYREAKRLLGQLEAAAQGRLRDSKGNVISAQQLAQTVIDKQEGLMQVNADYKSSVGMAKMGIVLAPVILVTTVATAGTGAAGWAAVAVGAGATALTEGTIYGTNLLTSETGNTAENRAAVTSQVLQDTFFAASGIKFGQFAENFAVHGIQAVSQVERTAFAPQTWNLISKVPEGRVKEFFGIVSKASAKLEQTSADVGAGLISKQANLLRKFAPGISDSQMQKAAVILARGEAAGLEITSDTVQTLGQMYLIDGEFNEQSFIEGMLMSVAGNTIGHISSLKSDLEIGKTPKNHTSLDVESVEPKAHADGVDVRVKDGETNAGNPEVRVEDSAVRVHDGPRQSVNNGDVVDGSKSVNQRDNVNPDLSEVSVSVETEALPSKPKLIDSNGVSATIEIDGKPVVVSPLIDITLTNGKYVNVDIPVDSLLREIDNPAIKQAIFNYADGDTIPASLIIRLYDLNQEMSLIKDIQMKQLINNEILKFGTSQGPTLRNLEVLISTQNAWEGNTAIVRGAGKYEYDGEANINTFTKYLNEKNQTLGDLNHYGDRIVGIETDNLLESRLYAIRQYMKTNPNTEISNYMYSKYLEELEQVGVPKSVVDKCRHMDSEYGCKITISADLREVNEVMGVIDAEFAEWKAASGGQAKFPPVVDFSTIKTNWYDDMSAYGQGTSAAYSESGYDGALSFSNMTENNVSYAIRHEMTHSNDLKHGYGISQELVDRVIVKKPRLDSDGNQVMDSSGRPVMDAELDKCMYVDEFRKAGISEQDIPYAYNNPMEFIAVASEGDLSKCSHEFRQLLLDFGMPEWQLNMRTTNEVCGIGKQNGLLDKSLSQINYTRESGNRVTRYVKRLFGTDERMQGAFHYHEGVDVISTDNFDISGVYIGNKIDVMGDMLEGKLPKGEAVIVAGDAKIRLGNSWTLDLSDPQVRAIVDNLEEGRVLHIGTEGNIVPSAHRGISGNHLEVRKVNGEIVVRDLSDNGSVILGAEGVSRSRQIAGRMRNYLASISLDEIPAELKGLWTSCRAEINDLANSFTLADININNLRGGYHKVMNKLSVLVSKTAGTLKVQFEKLMAKIKEMFVSFNSSTSAVVEAEKQSVDSPSVSVKRNLANNGKTQVNQEQRDAKTPSSGITAAKQGPGIAPKPMPAPMPSRTPTRVNDTSLGGLSVLKSTELTTTSGWQNFKTESGGITLVNSDGKIYLGQVGSDNTKQITLNPGERKNLGKTPDGQDLVLERSANGSYSVNTMGVKKRSFIDRLFGRNKTEQTPEPAYASTVSNTPTTPRSKSSAGVEIVRRQPTDASTPTNIVRDSYRVVAKTADGKLISAKISGDNFVISKNGVETEIPLSDIKEAGTYVVHETSTDTYLQCSMDKYGRVSVRRSQTPDEFTPIDTNTSRKTVTTQHSEAVSSTDNTSRTRAARTQQTEITRLTNLRKSNPQQYEMTVTKELNNLRQTNPKLYKKLENMGIMDGLNEPGGNQISARLLSAIQLENQGKTLVTHLPEGADISKISNFVGDGDVCSVNGKLYVNDNGNAVLLNLSPEKFEELFPPVESALIQQTMTSKACWFLSTLGSAMDTPKGRVALYQRFSQDGNDIILQSANPSQRVPIRFPDSKVHQSPEQVRGAKGLQMLEQAAALDKVLPDRKERALTERNIFDYKSDKIFERISFGDTQGRGVGLLGRFEKTVIGGTEHANLTPQQLDDIRQAIISTANDPNSATLISLNHAGHSIGWGLQNGHATKIVGYDPKTGIVELVDQQKSNGGAGIIRRYPLETIMENIASVTTTNFNPRVKS